MTMEMEIKNPPTTTAEIDAFQQRAELRLPASYIDFLLATNGGRPVNDTFPVRGMDLNPFGSVNFFFGIHPGREEYDLEEMYNWFHGGIPKLVVPIGENGGGDYICLDLRTVPPRVVFWDNRPFWGSGEWSESDLYFVADDFSSFLAELKRDPRT